MESSISAVASPSAASSALPFGEAFGVVGGTGIKGAASAPATASTAVGGGAGAFNVAAAAGGGRNVATALTAVGGGAGAINVAAALTAVGAGCGHDDGTPLARARAPQASPLEQLAGPEVAAAAAGADSERTVAMAGALESRFLIAGKRAARKLKRAAAAEEEAAAPDDEEAAATREKNNRARAAAVNPPKVQEAMLEFEKREKEKTAAIAAARKAADEADFSNIKKRDLGNLFSKSKLTKAEAKQLSEGQQLFLLHHFTLLELQQMGFVKPNCTNPMDMKTPGHVDRLMRSFYLDPKMFVKVGEWAQGVIGAEWTLRRCDVDLIPRYYHAFPKLPNGDDHPDRSKFQMDSHRQSCIFSLAEFHGSTKYEKMLHKTMLIKDYRTGETLLPYEIPFLQLGNPNAAAFWTQHPGPGGGVQWLFNLAAVYDYYIGPNKWFAETWEWKTNPETGKPYKAGTFEVFFPPENRLDPLHWDRMRDFHKYKELLQKDCEALIKAEADAKAAANKKEAAAKKKEAEETAAGAAALKAAQAAFDARNAAAAQSSQSEHADIVALARAQQAAYDAEEKKCPWKAGRVQLLGHPEVSCECRWDSPYPSCYCLDIGTRYPMFKVWQAERPATPSGYSIMELELNMEYINDLARNMLGYAIDRFKTELPSHLDDDGKEELHDWLKVFPIEEEETSTPTLATLAVVLPEREWGYVSALEEESCEEAMPNLREIYERYLRPHCFKLQESDDEEKLRVWFSSIDYINEYTPLVENYVLSLGYEILPREGAERFRFRMQEDPSRASRDPFALSPRVVARAATLTAVKLPPPPRVYGGVRLSSARPAPAPARPAPAAPAALAPARDAPAALEPAACGAELPAAEFTTMAARLAHLSDCAPQPACGAGRPPPAPAAGLPPPAPAAGRPPPAPAVGLPLLATVEELVGAEWKVPIITCANAAGGFACPFHDRRRGDRCHFLHAEDLLCLAHRETGRAPTFDDLTRGVDWRVWGVRLDKQHFLPRFALG